MLQEVEKISAVHSIARAGKVWESDDKEVQNLGILIFESLVEGEEKSL